MSKERILIDLYISNEGKLIKIVFLCQLDTIYWFY